MRQLLLWDPPTARRSGQRTELTNHGDGDRAVDEMATASDSAAWPATNEPRRPAPTVDVLVVPATDSEGPANSETRAAGPAPILQPNVEFVRHPRARRYLIRVRLDGSVRVTIPSRGSKREAVQFYEQQRDWVAAHQRQVAGVRASLPDDVPADEQRALQLKARRELPARLLELAHADGLSVRKVSVRNQRHRWGSCSQSGLICLNWRLVTMPDWVRDYVLHHELMHLKHMDHSPAFWACVEAVCPNYRAARRWLRRHALAPHSAAAHADTGTSGDDDEYHGEC